MYQAAIISHTSDRPHMKNASLKITTFLKVDPPFTVKSCSKEFVLYKGEEKSVKAIIVLD